MPATVRLGSRPSALALAQSGLVRARLMALAPELKIDLVEIRTSGDRMTQASLAQVGGKGLFIKELEQALLERRIDLAVHSMKDLPAELAGDFQVAAVPQRESTADVLVSRTGAGLAALGRGARVGTSSSRRRFQALRVNGGLEIVPLRGNVDTRLAKVANGSLDGAIVALAGLKRLGRTGDVKFVELAAADFIPAGGQGALAIETLAERRPGGSAELEHALAALNDARAGYETAAERGFLAAIGASCTTPLGVRASVANDTLAIRAILFSPDGARELADSLAEPLDADLAPSAARRTGEALADRMLARGAAALLSDG